MALIAALAVGRLLRDASVLFLWGSCIYITVVVPPALRGPLLARYTPLHRAAGAALAVAVVALLPVQAAALGEGWPAAIDPETVRAMLFDTTIGMAWLAQAAACVVLLLALKGVRGTAAAALAAAALLAATTITGHAAMREGWLGALQRANAILHLLAGGFWLGALVPLLGTLAMLSAPPLDRAAALALRRFSTIGHGAVAAVIGSGLGNAGLVLGRWPAEPSLYLFLLAAKIAAVALMTALAIVNRYIYVPLIPGDRSLALRRIRQATLAEVALGLLAVALVAWFGELDPT